MAKRGLDPLTQRLGPTIKAVRSPRTAHRAPGRRQELRHAYREGHQDALGALFDGCQGQSSKVFQQMGLRWCWSSRTRSRRFGGDSFSLPVSFAEAC